VGSVQQHREANSPQLASPFSWRSSKQIRRCYKLTDEITSQSPGFSRPLRKLSQPPTPLSPAHGSQSSDDTPGKVVTGRMIREFSLPHGDGRWGEPPWARLSIFPVVSIPPPPPPLFPCVKKEILPLLVIGVLKKKLSANRRKFFAYYYYSDQIWENKMLAEVSHVIIMRESIARDYEGEYRTWLNWWNVSHVIIMRKCIARDNNEGEYHTWL